ncbi:MAG TPA: SpoIIE family protein phosphatase, partial [Ktedonobacterales bacterium]|nr:SpoIIE family protein phosphatase [Ktedonobacterales bacterium]
WELLTHAPTTPEIVVVTTTLAIAVVFEPLRTYLQAFLEQRFHLRDDATTKAVEAFTATLREEIDLHQVRERFLAVVQQILHPQTVSLWVRAPAHDTPESLLAPAAGLLDDRRLPGGAPADEQPSLPQSLAAEPPVMGLDLAPATVNVDVSIADADPLIAYALSHPGAVELDRLQLDSPAVRTLKASATEIVLPLACQGELLGLLTLGPRLGVERRTSAPFIGQFMPLLSLLNLFRSGPRVYELEYTREDRALLSALAAQVAPALSVAQLVRAQQAQVRERERIEQELRTAQASQRTFLPKDTPSLPGWQLIPYYQPAHEVGGDFYDFLQFEDGRIGLVIGDVTAKGIPAALVMTATRTMIRTAAQERESPGEVFARVNDLLYADIPAGMF